MGRWAQAARRGSATAGAGFPAVSGLAINIYMPWVVLEWASTYSPIQWEIDEQTFFGGIWHQISPGFCAGTFRSYNLLVGTDVEVKARLRCSTALGWSGWSDWIHRIP